jgi:hypothetical protein
MNDDGKRSSGFYGSREREITPAFKARKENRQRRLANKRK